VMGEALVGRWAENVVWQLFSGMEYYEPRMAMRGHSNRPMPKKVNPWSPLWWLCPRQTVPAVAQNPPTPTHHPRGGDATGATQA
jgi:hypothetical protein